jgi:chemotaxis protein methyltransferase CheR
MNTPTAPLARPSTSSSTGPTTPASNVTPLIRPTGPLPAAPGAPVGATVAAPASNRPQLSDALFQKFAAIVYDLSGMRFDVSKSYFLASKIDLRVQALGLKNFDDYLRFLESPSGRPEYGYLVDEVTINETFFYRHEPQLQSFKDNLLLPLVTARRNQKQTRLRIWSAAASTGDELYTLALMIKDLGLLGKDLTFELVGTDICHDALEKARAGVYRKYNVRNIPPALLNQHFVHDPASPSGESWTLKPEIRNLAKFQEGNLMDASRCGALGKFDFIFCRNVLIYFDEPSKEKAVQNLANNLLDDGFILLGHSENVYSQRHIIRPDKTHTAAIAYQKAPPGTPKYNI